MSLTAAATNSHFFTPSHESPLYQKENHQSKSVRGTISLGRKSSKDLGVRQNSTTGNIHGRKCNKQWYLNSSQSLSWNAALTSSPKLDTCICCCQTLIKHSRRTACQETYLDAILSVPTAKSMDYLSRSKTPHLIIIFLVFVCLSFTKAVNTGNRSFLNENPEGDLSDFSQEFQVVTPVFVSEDYPSQEKGDLHFLITADGQQFLVDITRNKKLATRNLYSQNLGRSVSEWQRLSTDCLYTGKLRGNHDSHVALNVCHGLTGMIRTPEDDYFIEPVREGNAPVETAHRIYRRQSLNGHNHQSNDNSCISGIAGSKNQPRRSGRGQRSIKNAKHQSSLPVPHEVDVELMVVVDKEMIRFHGNDSIVEYVLTIMNMVDELYKDPSLGIIINIHIVKILLLHDDQPDLQIGHHGNNALFTFCEWQHSRTWFTGPNSAEYLEYDAAVLLTRKDICASKDEPCGTVGMAYISGMCLSNRKCSVCEDNGLTLAFTIAHELGHNLGMYHDLEDNECDHSSGRVPHIMSSKWSKSDQLGILRWSTCSRREIGKFLQSDDSLCVHKNTRKSSVVLPTSLPGSLYDADDQCRKQYGNLARHCSQTKDNLCVELWCEIKGETVCRSKQNPPVKGTPCGPGKWCMFGECVSNLTIPQMRHGGWGEWGKWTPCSRTCGIGVKYMERMCNNPRPLNGGKYCEGKERIYKTCNTKICPRDSRDFRAVQCAEFDGINEANVTQTWTPVISDEQPCALFCKPDDSKYHFSARLTPKVVDGTPCRLGSRDICIDGKCQSVGCDLKLGSSAREDMCGVCQGNGTTCRVIEGRFDQLAGSGYVEVAVIPVGARGISVLEAKPCASFLALKGDVGRYYINGNWKIELPGQFNANGTTIYYTRKGTLEQFLARGPTKEPLHIMILYQGFNFGVKYRYSLPLNDSRGYKKYYYKVKTSNYGWVHGGWGPCSARCGGGIRHSLKPRCISVNSGNLTFVVSSFCAGATKHRYGEERVCNQHKCPIWWSVTSWRKCSKKCGVGIQSRNVTCLQQLRNGKVKIASDSKCPKDKPSGLQTCIERACFLQWRVGKWSECYGLCGAGKRHRVVSCPAPKMCNPKTKPITKKRCMKHPCFQWKVEEWGECSVTCGQGVQRRNVQCVHRLKGELGTECKNGTRPPSHRHCDQDLCQKNTHCDGDTYNMAQCSSVLKFNLCYEPAWFDLCCETCLQGFKARRNITQS